MLNIIVLSVVMLSVVMLSVKAPPEKAEMKIKNGSNQMTAPFLKDSVGNRYKTFFSPRQNKLERLSLADIINLG
jgi:hypothetical protein